MNAQPRGPADYPLDRLTAGQFESLVFLLARAVDPRVVPVRRKDHGLDARLPGSRTATLRGWQAKRYTGSINWEECRESVRRARAFWRPPRVTFCFPRDLSAIEQRSFVTDLAEHFRDVRLDFWPGSELERLIRDTEEGRRAAAWLFTNPQADHDAMLRALAVGGELNTSQQALERQAVIQHFLDRDPHLHYNLVSRSPGAPETPAADETILSVTLIVGGQEVRLDASPRYDGAARDAGAIARLAFTEDAAGREARDTLERLAREGGRATVAAGLGATLEAVPVGLRGLMPEDGVWGAAEVIAQEQPKASSTLAPEFQQPVIVRAGEAELAMLLVPRDPSDGWDGLIAGAAGGLEMFFSVRKQGDRIESRLDWRFTVGEGSAADQHLAAQIMLAAMRGHAVDLIEPSDDRVLVSGTADDVEDRGAWAEQLEERVRFLGYVTEVEAWTGATLRPPARPAEHDAAALSAVIPVLRQPESTLTWTEVRVAPGAQRPVDDGPVQVAVLRPLHVSLFGEELYLGIEMLHFERAVFREDQDGLALVPDGDVGRGTSRLSHPEEAPPEAARPRM